MPKIVPISLSCSYQGPLIGRLMPVQDQSTPSVHKVPSTIPAIIRTQNAVYDTGNQR